MNDFKMTDNAFLESGYLATDDPWLEGFNYYQLFDRGLVLSNDEIKIIESDYDYEIKIGHKAFSKVLWGYNTNAKMYMFLKLIPNQKIIINIFINGTDYDKYLGKLVESHSVIIKPELTTHVDYCNKFIKKYMEIQNKRELVTFDILTSNFKDYIIRFLLRLRCHTKWSKYDTSLIVG